MKFRKTLTLFTVIFCISALILTGCAGDNTATPDETEAPPASAAEITVDTYEIETPYGNILYPKKWEDSIFTVAGVDGDTYTLEFHGHITDNNDKHLFDVVFGGTDGAPIGTLDGVSVSIVSYEVDPADWSEEDLDTIYMMQEDVNTVISSISQLDNFVFAD